jgi:hypothetical protein
VNTNESLYDHDILEEKISWIKTNYISLLLLAKAVGLYKEDQRDPGEQLPDFLTHFSHVFLSQSQELIETFCLLDTSESPAMAKEVPETDSIFDEEDQYRETIKRLSSSKYKSSIDFDDILHDLGFLWAYWTTCRSSNPGWANGFGVSEAGLDMALVKLSKNIGGWGISAMFYGTRILYRTLKGTKEKKERDDKRREFIIAIYEHGKAIEAGTKSNMAYTIIREQFEDSRGKEGPWGTIPKDPKKMPTPSLDSIKRWLMEEGIRDRDFKHDRRFWIKQT